MAQISTSDAGSLLVQPYDKSSLKAIEKALAGSNLGWTPNNDEEIISLTLLQLTSERRKELSKIVAKQAEEGNKVTDEYMKKIDSICKQKEKELLTVQLIHATCIDDTDLTLDLWKHKKKCIEPFSRLLKLKLSPRQSQSSPKKYQKLLFIDKDETQVQAIIYSPDMSLMENVFHVRETYFITS